MGAEAGEGPEDGGWVLVHRTDEQLVQGVLALAQGQ